MSRDERERFAIDIDTKDVRPAASLAFALLNDRDRKVRDVVQGAVRSDDITPIVWSMREDFRERLAAGETS
jgi:hypothetical protein